MKILITGGLIGDVSIDMMKFYRKETHSIYMPKLSDLCNELDVKFVSGDLTEVEPIGIMSLIDPMSYALTEPKPKHKPKKGHMAAKFGGRERWQR